jgi:hypothetical protein
MEEKRRLPFVWLIIMLGSAALIGLCFTPVLAEESFGTNSQTTWIPAVDFTPRDSSTIYEYWGLGYRYLTNGTNMDAGIRLPSGALLISARLFYYDNDSGLDPGLRIIRINENPPDPATVLCILTPDSGTPGYDDSDSGCSSIDEEIDNFDKTYIARVFVNGAAGDDLRFKGVRLEWSRQISPAPATATFNDVPPGSFGFQQIEALADSGITGGCGGDNFCPNNPLTRAQMAVFLAKALGLYFQD